MAINPAGRYPGKIKPPSTGYPYGSARNITVANDGTGTPFEENWLNDFLGFIQSALSDMGAIPNGNPDSVINPQILTAVKRAKELQFLTEARTKVGSYHGELRYLVGRSAINDGGEGYFLWDSTSTLADDGGTIYKPASVTTGRWKRVYGGVAIIPAWFGSKNGTSIVSACTVAKARGEHVSIVGGEHTVNATGLDFLSVPLKFLSGSTLTCPDAYVSPINVNILDNSAKQIFTCSIGNEPLISENFTIYPENFGLYLPEISDAADMIIKAKNCLIRSGGGEVVFKSITYNCGFSSTKRIDLYFYSAGTYQTARITFKGQKDKSIIKNNDTSGNGSFVLHYDKAIVGSDLRGFVLDGVNIQGNAASSHGIMFNGVTPLLKLKDSLVSGHGGSGAILKDCYAASIEDCNFSSNCANSGLTETSYLAVKAGLYLYGSNNTDMRGVRVNLNYTRGLRMELVAGTSVTSCQFEDNLQNGIYLYEAIGNCFSGNYIENNGAEADPDGDYVQIKITGGVSDRSKSNTFSGNFINGGYAQYGESAANRNYGFYIAYAKGTVLIGNCSYNHRQASVYFATTEEGTQLANNLFGSAWPDTNPDPAEVISSATTYYGTRFTRQTASDGALEVRAAGDTRGRCSILANGNILWSDGTHAGSYDTILRRSAANKLSTGIGDDFEVLGTTDSTSKDTGAIVTDGGIGAELSIVAGKGVTGNTSNDAASVSNIPTWIKKTITHTALQAAAIANDIELISLPAGGMIQAIKVRHTTLFSGSGITDYKVSVGITGNLIKFTAAFDVDTAVTGTNLQITNVLYHENHTAATSIRIAATSAGANLSNTTQGQVDVWLLISKAI